MKKGLTGILVFCLMVALVSPMATDIQAKSKSVSLSVKSKTLVEGQQYTLKLNNASSKAKITWKCNNNDVIEFISKKKKSVTFKVLEDGKGTISVIYQISGKKKVLKCKIKAICKKAVESDKRQNFSNEDDDTDAKPESSDNVGHSSAEGKGAVTPCLNVTCAAIYYWDTLFDDYISPEQGHNAKFQFKVLHTNKKVKEWEILGKDASEFFLSDNGLVSGKFAPAYDIHGKPNFYEGIVQATLSDGTKLQAKVYLYDEVTNYLYHSFDRFIEHYINADMTELEKVEAVAKYVGECSDYDSTVHSWKELFIKGVGDCQASRYAVQYLCQYIGIRAGACRNVKYHGQTLVLAEGSYHLVVTGYDMPRPRGYSISDVPEDEVAQFMEERQVIKSYFREDW